MNSRALIRRLDKIIGYWVGKLIVLAFPPQPQDNVPKQIIFIKLWGIGEAILTLPALSALSKKHQDAHITVLTTPYVAAVFSGQPYIDTLVVRSLFVFPFYAARNFRTFDWSIDGEPYAFFSAIAAFILGKKVIGFSTCDREFLFTNPIQYNDKQHVVETYIDLTEQSPELREDRVNKLVPLAFKQQDEIFANEYLKMNNIEVQGTIVALCPSVGGSAKNRMWPTHRWAQVATELLEKAHAQVILVGSKQDISLLQSIAGLVDQPIVQITTFTLPQISYLFTLCKTIISCDSGLMHVSASMGTPTVGLFGPNTPIRFAPLGKHNISIFHPCPESPHINVHKGEISETACECMKNISTKEIAREAQLRVQDLDPAVPDLYTYNQPQEHALLYRPWDSQAMQECFRKEIMEHTMLSNLKLYMLRQGIFQTHSVPGDIIEAGVWNGGSAKVIIEASESLHTSKDIWLIDTFCGYEEIDTVHDNSRMKPGDCKGLSAIEVAQFLKMPRKKVHIIEGSIPSALLNIRTNKISFAHIDVNLYKPTLAATEFCLQRMPVGGMIIFDDYNWPSTYGARKAIDEMCEKYNQVIFSLPESTQAILIKR